MKLLDVVEVVEEELADLVIGNMICHGSCRVHGSPIPHPFMRNKDLPLGPSHQYDSFMIEAQFYESGTHYIS